MELPTLENKRIGPLGVTLVDAENVSPQRYERASEIAARVLENRLLGRIRPQVRLCGPDHLEFAGDNYRRYHAANPGATWDDFLAERPEEVVADDASADPRLAVKQIIVRDNTPERSVMGLFVLYNVVIERDRPLRLVISAMPLPGCRAAEGFTLRQTWSRIMRRILEDPWPMEDGRNLDVIEWRFPMRRGHRWKLRPEELQYDGDGEGDGVCDRIVTDLSDHDRTDEDGAPKKIRRRENGGAGPGGRSSR